MYTDINQMEINNNNHRDLGLLRFTTAGSVDDGKSTLIGRLLYDSKSIFEDQMEHITESSKRRGKDEVDLALLTDGLRSEREQGITIDVAYRYFSTPKRKFIIADTPGHIQYTRNMVTGASTAELAVILIDARNGVVEQTLRHTYIASLLNIKHIIFCVNKMDLVDYKQEVYEDIKSKVEKIVERLEVKNAYYVPISAKLGDNVVEKLDNQPWYSGPTFLDLLETIDVREDHSNEDARFPVQYVVRPQTAEHPDFRGYAGRIASGEFHKGDEITVLPSMLKSKIKAINKFEKDLEMAGAGESVVISLEDEIDISRGNMISSSENLPEVAQELKMMVCWFNERPMQVRGKYALRHTSNETRCMITGIEAKMNINTLEADTEDKSIKMNDIARITLKTTHPVFVDDYKKNEITGSVIIIDEATNETMGAGMIIGK
jgi:sulfate adenylyltransferase subunit 1